MSSRAEVFPSESSRGPHARPTRAGHRRSRTAAPGTGLIGFADPFTARGAAHRWARGTRLPRWSWCRASRARRAWTRCRRWPPSPATRPCSSRPTHAAAHVPDAHDRRRHVAPARAFSSSARASPACRPSRPRARLGAASQAYDVRPAVKEQINSLGAKFVELPLETARAEGQGRIREGAGRSLLPRQRETMAKVVAGQRRRHHDGRHPGREVADASSPPRWSPSWRPARSSSTSPPSAAATAS